MESLLKGIPNVSVYLDDTLVSGTSDKAHLDNLESVLSGLEAAGFRLKQNKCTFFLPEVVSRAPNHSEGPSSDAT